MGYAPVIEEIRSKITSKGQTTVPKTVRQALGVDEGDEIAYRVDENGVTLRRADEERMDPAIASFLSFLARDIEKNPANLKALSPDLIGRIRSLTSGVDIDVDAPIEGDVSL
jgi:antitoxin PrlF